MKPAVQYDQESHFTDRSAPVREIYAALISASRKFGPVEEDPKKTRSTSTGKPPLPVSRRGGII